jgi:DNA-binding protein H-NS
MELSKLNLAELKDLLVQAGAELKNREKADLDAARNEINAIAQRMGLSLKDLIGAGAGKGKVRKQTGKVAIQYRNPQDASQEWTGRGRQPNWVKELVASGKNLMSAKVSS